MENVKYLPVTAAIVLYNFQIPRLVPQLRSALFDTSHFPYVLSSGLGISSLIYIAVGLLGFVAYNRGPDTLELFTDNMTPMQTVKTILFVLVLIATLLQHGS